MIKLPIFPLSVLMFYILLILSWSFNIIPSTAELVLILERLFKESGYLWLALAAFLEGTAYICLYVPGSFVIAFSVFFSDHSPSSLLVISLLVATALTFAALVNYQLGRFVSLQKMRRKVELVKKSNKFSKKSLFVSLLHPNLLAFYFFNAGLKGKSLKQIVFVPLFMFPYGLFIAYFLSMFAEEIRSSVETPMFIVGILFFWVIISFWKDNKKVFKILAKQSVAYFKKNKKNVNTQKY